MSRKTQNDKRPKAFIVVRGTGCGVICGYLAAKTAEYVTITEPRQIWRWRGANTLMEVSTHGVAEDYTRISEPGLKAQIPIRDVCAILYCTDIARENLIRSRWGT